MHARSVPFWISAFIHLAVFGTAALLFIKPPQFAMDNGHNSVEVSLVAAAPDPIVPPPVPVPVPEMPALEQPPKPDDLVVPVKPPTPVIPPPLMPVPQPVAVQPPRPIEHPKPHPKTTLVRGDGSAPQPGKDAISAHSDGGAILDAKADYLSNPPPVYPELSRKEKQAGLVVLVVIVSAEGRSDSVTVRTGSGFDALDQSAVTAVQGWRFRPASLGTLNVRSRVIVPVRFRLDE